MGLVFKQFNLAVPYRFGKEETLPLVAIYGTIIFGNTFLEGQIHEKRKQTTTIYTFILLKSFFSSTHKIIPLRPVVDLKFTLLGDASRSPVDVYVFYFTDPKAKRRFCFLPQWSLIRLHATVVLNILLCHRYTFSGISRL